MPAYLSTFTCTCMSNCMSIDATTFLRILKCESNGTSLLAITCQLALLRQVTKSRPSLPRDLCIPSNRVGPFSYNTTAKRDPKLHVVSKLHAFETIDLVVALWPVLAETKASKQSGKQEGVSIAAGIHVYINCKYTLGCYGWQNNLATIFIDGTAPPPLDVGWMRFRL